MPQINCKIILSPLAKNFFEIRTGMCWNRYKNFGKIVIWIRFTLPANGRPSVEVLPNLVGKDLPGAHKLLLKVSVREPVTEIPKYLYR